MLPRNFYRAWEKGTRGGGTPRISRSMTSGTPASRGQPPRARQSESSYVAVVTPALVPRSATSAPPRSRTELSRMRCRKWQPQLALELCGP